MITMLRPIVLGLGAVAMAATLALPQDPPAEKADPKTAKEAVQQLFQAYTQAFQRNDAKAVAALWTENCVYTDRPSGDRSEGRKAIQSDMAQLFKDHPKARLVVDFTSVRFIKPEVAAVEGRASLLFADQDPSVTTFSALVVKQDSGWLIDTVSETDVPTPSSSADALKDLDWLVGQWRDATEGVDVKTDVHWTANRSFLIRSYKVQVGDDEPYEGTQVIGWDARKKQIRSWSFDSDGSFDEATWSKNGDEWLIRMARTEANGDTASGTQVLKPVNPDTLTVQTIARDLNGEPAPASNPVTVVRVKASDADK